MKADSSPPPLEGIPGFAALTPENRDHIQAMFDSMSDNGLPSELIQAGLRSTTDVLLNQQAADTPRMESDHVRRFIEGNKATPVVRRSRTAPRNESRQRSVESMHERLGNLILMARTANRRHEMLRVRREMLGLDQGFIRRTLGSEGDRLCGEMNSWLIETARRLKS